MSIDRLPDEILLVIFGFIDDYRERTGLERVCWRWHKIILKHGWKHVQHIELNDMCCIEAIGRRCGAHLAECSFNGVKIDSALIRLVAEHFPALKHLYFRCCKLELNSDVLELFQGLGPPLRFLFFFDMKYECQPDNHHFLSLQPNLRHLGLDLLCVSNMGFLPKRFSADLRSLYLSYYMEYSAEPILAMAQRDSPKLAALYLDTALRYNLHETCQLLSRISVLKNLRFLRLLCSAPPQLLCSCLNNLPRLLALQLILTTQLRGVLHQSLSFRGLVHLSLSIILHPSDNYEPIGLLSDCAPQLRSFSLHIRSPAYSSEQTNAVGCELLKIANNRILEYLNVPSASFTFEMLVQLIRLCPNLHSLAAQLLQNELLPRIAELSHIVAEQWRASMRKHLALRIWMYDHGNHHEFSWRDAFLSVRTVKFGFAPPNPVLDALLWDQVFNDDSDDAGRTPLFVTELYSSKI